MSRPIRLEFPGALYHVTSRGNERRDIFCDDFDRQRFLDLLGEAVRRFRWILTAYVLMSNHFHLVIELTELSLARGMAWLNGTYSQWFNRRHGRVGHLIQHRPDEQLVEEETYAREVQRYVVLNPVRANMVDRPEKYEWSSYRAVIGEADVPPWLAVDDVLIHFGPTRPIAREYYKQFVDAGIGLPGRPWDDLVGQTYLGSPEWIERMREQIELKPRARVHLLDARRPIRPTMAEIVSAVASAFGIPETSIRCGRGGLPRMLAAWLGCYEAMLTNAEIAAALRLRSDKQVTNLVRQCEGEFSCKPTLREAADACLSTIGGETTNYSPDPNPITTSS